jgi:hypothetical protein
MRIIRMTSSNSIGDCYTGVFVGDDVTQDQRRHRVEPFSTDVTQQCDTVRSLEIVVLSRELDTTGWMKVADD